MFQEVQSLGDKVDANHQSLQAQIHVLDVKLEDTRNDVRALDIKLEDPRNDVRALDCKLDHTRTEILARIHIVEEHLRDDVTSLVELVLKKYEPASDDDWPPKQ